MAGDGDGSQQPPQGNFLQGPLKSQDGSRAGMLPPPPPPARSASLLVQRNCSALSSRDGSDSTQDWVQLNDSSCARPLASEESQGPWRKITGGYDSSNP